MLVIFIFLFFVVVATMFYTLYIVYQKLSDNTIFICVLNQESTHTYYIYSVLDKNMHIIDNNKAFVILHYSFKLFLFYLLYCLDNISFEKDLQSILSKEFNKQVKQSK